MTAIRQPTTNPSAFAHAVRHVLEAELTKEFFERRALTERHHIVLACARLGDGIKLHPHRDDGGLHLFDNVGKSPRLRGGLGRNCGGHPPGRRRGRLQAGAGREHRNAETASRSQQRDPAHAEFACEFIINVRHTFFSICEARRALVVCSNNRTNVKQTCPAH